MADITTLLPEVDFFKHLNSEHLESLAQLFVLRAYKPGETIFLVGEPGDSLYVVKSGEVELFLRHTTGNRVTLAYVGEAGLFGELSLLDGGPRSASAEARSDTELYELDREHLERYLGDHPHAALGFLSILGQKLRNADNILRGHEARNVNAVIEQELRWFERMASRLADLVGSVPFLSINCLIFIVWILWNLGLLPNAVPFDPFPFGFLTMVVSLEAIILSILVLVAQNLQTSRDRIRGDLEYDINLRAELEVSHLHTKVDLMHAEILSRLHQLEKKSP
ncbi:MAG: DUF1003 domain-containing protein [Oligoflexia bacterium]|nr:DUF1003 domain-containing protein [Oligoflexia bacterium]